MTYTEIVAADPETADRLADALITLADKNVDPADFDLWLSTLTRWDTGERRAVSLLWRKLGRPTLAATVLRLIDGAVA